MLVLQAGCSQEALPRRNGRPAAQGRPSLTFGHTAPDAVLDALVQGVGQAFGAHGAAGTHSLRPVSRSSLDEQFVRVGALAQPAVAPAGIRYRLGTVPSCTRSVNSSWHGSMSDRGHGGRYGYSGGSRS